MIVKAVKKETVAPDQIRKPLELTAADRRKIHESKRGYENSPMKEWYERDALDEKSDLNYINRFNDGKHLFVVMVETCDHNMKVIGTRCIGRFFTGKDAMLCKKNYKTNHLNTPELRATNEIKITVKEL